MKNLFLELSSKELQKKSGIYKIICNDRFYIGSSKDLYARLHEHRRHLGFKKHPNDFLQKAYNKYGQDHILYEIVEFCNPEERITKESYYIQNLKPDFNLQLDPIDRTLSNYSRQKLSKSVLKGRAEGKYKTKYDYTEVEMYDYLGNYLKSFKNKEEAAKELKISKKQVNRLAGGYKKGVASENGYRLRYSNSSVPVQKFNVIPNALGRRFFFEIKNDNEEYLFAFRNIRDCWQFFTDQVNKGNFEFTIRIRPNRESN